MKVQVISPFAPRLGENYNVGDKLEMNDEAAKKLIAAGLVVEGELKPYENFNPFATVQTTEKPKVENKIVPKPVRKAGRGRKDKKLR